ncbi:MAG: TonB-dependent receptor, partial [Parahaliea sp.]
MNNPILRRRLLATALGGCALAGAARAENPQMEVVEVHADRLDRKGLALDSQNSAASRLGLSIQDIPASVSVVDREAMAVKGDFSGLSAVTRAAGFAASATPGNGGTSTSVRGFNGHGSVVYTYDGTRLYVGAGTVNFPADTWTVERIEVLRGPGSVINGVGAIGATVNYLPKKPAFKPMEHEIAVTAGSFNLQRYALGSGGQINDRLAYRLDAVNHSSDGYVDRAEEERSAIAGALLFKAGEHLELQLSIDYADTEAAPYWGTPLVDGNIPDRIRRNNYNVADGLVEYEDLWPRFHLQWDIDERLQLRSDTYYLTSERHWRNVESYDYNPDSGLVDRYFYLEILHEQEQLGNRSDLLVSLPVGGMNNRLSVGFEVNQIDFSHSNNSPYLGASSVDLRNPDPGTWAEGVGSETTRDFDTKTTQYALFIDNVLEISDQWHLVAGLRQDEIDYQRSDLARSNGQPAAFIDTDFSGTSWRLGAVYKPAEHTSIYLQYSTAVDAIQSLISATNPDLDLAEGEQFEAGIKQQLLEGKLQYTLSLYDITKSDLISSDPGGIQRQI